MFGLAHDLIEQLEQSPLLRSRQLRVADNVNKEHVGNLKLDLFFNLSRTLLIIWRHALFSGRSASAEFFTKLDWVASREILGGQSASRLAN